MNVWMAMKGALTVMDMVTRGWARQLEVDECGVMVLMRLGYRESASAAKLALFCGRARQQVQRSLRILQEAGLVQPATIARDGRTASWTLTEKGWRRWRSLERAVRAWEETLEQSTDVQLLTELLGRVVEVAVNRPSADGWRKGLLEPYELVKVPLWFQLLIEDSSLEPSSSGPLPHDQEAARKERERERAERDWGAMWMRISS